MRNFYKRLFPALALQSYDHVPIDDVILDTYKRIMTRLQADTADLPPTTYIELRYEELERDPIGQIEKIYRQLKIDGIEEARPKFEDYLSTILSYKKNRYSYTEETAKIVGREEFLRKARFKKEKKRYEGLDYFAYHDRNEVYDPILERYLPDLQRALQGAGTSLKRSA